MTSIDEAIALAKKQAETAAANLPAEVSGVSETQMTHYTPVSTAAPLDADDMLAGDLGVKTYFKFSEHGITVGNDKKLYDAIDVTVDMSEVQYCFAVKFGNPARYEQTLNRQVSLKGLPWVSVLEQAKKIDPKCTGEYRSANIPFVVNEELKSKDGKEVLVEEGDRVGYSLATTAWGVWSQFLKALQKRGIDHKRGVVRFTLGCDATTRNGNTWGLLSIKDIQEVKDAFASEAA